MKRIVLAFAVLLTAAAAAAAAGEPAAAPCTLGSPCGITEQKQITVSDVVNLRAVISILSAKDKDGKPLYRFQGDVLMSFAAALQQAELQFRAYQETYRTIVAQVYGGERAANELAAKINAANAQNEKAKIDPKIAAVDVPVDEHSGELTAQLNKAFNAPSPFAAFIPRIKKDDLCLTAKEPACPVANPITVDVLTLLLPMIDR